MLLLGTAVEKSTLPVDIARKLAQQPPSYNTFNTAADHKYGDGAIFRGFIVDTGAAIVSTVGQFQLSAYQSEYGGELDTITAGSTSVSFGPGKALSSLGTAPLKTPIGTVLFHVMLTPTPFILSLADMDRLGFKFDNLANVMLSGDEQKNTSCTTIRTRLHSMGDISYCLF